MSVAEKSVDCVKADEPAIKKMPTPTPTLSCKETSVQMEVDAGLEKTENLNGSELSTKKEIDCEMQSIPPKVESMQETVKIAMDEDMPNNGTIGEVGENDEENEGDIKTVVQVDDESRDHKGIDVLEKIKDGVKNEEVKETIDRKDPEKINEKPQISEDVVKTEDVLDSLDQENTQDQVENKDNEEEDREKTESEEKTKNETSSEETEKKKDCSKDETESKDSKLGKNRSSSIAKEKATNFDESNLLSNMDNKLGKDPAKEKEQASNEREPMDEEQLLDEDHEMTQAAAKDDLIEEKQRIEDHELVKEANTHSEPARGCQEITESLYIDEGIYFKNEKIVELSRCSWSSKSNKQQYVRGCMWSPDGTCILAAVNMDGMHVINLPNDLYSNETVSPERPLDILHSVIHVKESGTVYDYCWYPFMISTMPETCCWISSRQHCPIQLWDGFDGELRASYRGYDNVDEVEAAFSVTFTSDAEKIVGGYKKTLKIFDTKTPGREYTVIPIKQPCSCFAVQATQSDIIATGSWNCSINLYDLRTPKFGSLVTLSEHVGGVTFLKFSATGDSLFSGARKDNALYEWDMRNFSKPIRKLSRNVKTNQRIYFDLSCGERWLTSGDTDGLVHVWDLHDENKTKEFKFSLHNDCCNGVSFHPSRSMLATCSGQFHFLDEQDTKDRAIEMYENSLIFWWFGNITVDENKDADMNDSANGKEKAQPIDV